MSKYSNKKSNRNKKSRKAIKRTFLSILVIFIVIFSVAVGIGLGVIAKIIKNAPDLEMLSIEPTEYTTIFKDMNGVEVERYHGDENREYVQLSEIPEYFQNAIIAVEDERFYKHCGIDFRGILRAAFTTIKNKITGQSGIEGASTLTQQLIKNNVTKVTRNTLETKIQEQYLAVKYESYLKEQLGSKEAAKKYILEVYLNTVTFGHGYNGVQAAALGYFNKNASELTLAESAAIAAITNNPSLYSPRTNPEGNRNRQIKILNKMLEQKMITQEEYDEAIAEDVYSKISQTSSNQKVVEGNVIHSYFADSAFEQISQDLQDKYKISAQQANNLLYRGGLEVNLTLDSNAQAIVDEAFANEDLFPDVTYAIDVTYNVSIINNDTSAQEHFEYTQFVKTKEEGEEFIANKRAEIEESLASNESILAESSTFSIQPQASMIIIDYENGYVRAIAGSRDEKVVNRGFNRATDAVRQPGSVFKVLAAFAPGIDTGVLTPATVIDDVPFEKADYAPSNWYSGYRGLSTVRDGIKNSMNIVAVKAMDMTGVQTAYQYLLNFGFTTLEDDAHLATALGGITNGVTLLEVTAAYGAIANEGKYIEPKFYTTVLDHSGNVLLDATEDREEVQVLKESTAFLLTDMMKDVITSGTGTRAQFKTINMPVAGKTGTSQDSKDLTFIGYTPYYVAGIWTGYDRYDSLVPSMSGILSSESYHVEIWRQVMEALHQDLEVVDFNKPSDIVQMTVCKDSGLLPTELCYLDLRGDRTYTEYFAKDNVPTEECDVHASVKICTDSGKIATDNCPEDSVVTKVGIVRPIPYTGTEVIDDAIYEINTSGETCDIHSSSDYIYIETTEITTEEQTVTTTVRNKFDGPNFDGPNFDDPDFNSTTTTTLPDLFGKPIDDDDDEDDIVAENTIKNELILY